VSDYDMSLVDWRERYLIFCIMLTLWTLFLRTADVIQCTGFILGMKMLSLLVLHQFKMCDTAKILVIFVVLRIVESV